MTSPTGVVFDSIYYTGATDLSPQDSGDGYSHANPTSTSPLSFNWQLSNGSHSTGWSAAAWEFKSAATAVAPTTASLRLPSGSVGMAPLTTETNVGAAQGQSTVTLAVSPRRSAVTSAQTQQFDAIVSNDSLNLGVSWLVDGTPSGAAATGTITPWGLFTPGTRPGPHTITAVSLSDPSVTASVDVAVTDLAGVFTQQNDPARTGQNPQEYALSPATVNAGTF